MRPVKQILTVCLVAMLVTSGCAQPPSNKAGSTAGTPAATTSAATSSTTPGAPAGGGAKSGLPLVNPPFPGPYKTVLVDGVEMRQGRYDNGVFGGNLVRSIVGSEPKTFNVWTAADTQSSQLGGLMFGGLITTDAYTGEVIPDMAKEIKVEPDGLTYITVLRKGLTWSDGKPVTAEDVAFTWNTIVAGGYGNSSLRDVTTIDGKSPQVTVVDQLTNKFVTPKTFAPFKRLLGIPIAPKHLIEPILKTKNGREAFQQLWSAASIDPKTLVTSGPFVLDRYVPAQRVEFVPTKNYYMVNKAGKRLPYLGRLIFQIVPDVMANLFKFRAKEIDMTPVRAKDTVELMAAQQAENFKLYNLGPSIGTTFLMFNMNQRKNPKTGKPYVDPVKAGWFNDVNFRQAVNHALSRKHMIDNYLKGIGSPLFTAEPPASPYFNASLKGFAADSDYAMSLLQKSGFQKHDDGFLYDRKANKVEFDMLAGAGGTFYEAVGNIIVEDLKKLGMKVNFQMIDFNTQADKISNSLDWQACLFALSPGDPLEPNEGANVYKTAARLHVFDQRSPDASGNITVSDARPWESRLDQIFNKGATTLDDKKRKELYYEYQKIIYDEAPFIFLVSPMSIVGVRNTIGNYVPTQLSQAILGLHNLEEIYKKK